VEVKRAEDPNKPSIPIFGKSSILCLVSEICDAYIFYHAYISWISLRGDQGLQKIVLFN